MAFKMKGSPMKRNFGIGASPMKNYKKGYYGESAMTKTTETNPDGTKRSNPKDDVRDQSGNTTDSPVWSKKASRLVEKRGKKLSKKKDTTRIQKKINKELDKLNREAGTGKYKKEWTGAEGTIDPTEG